MRIFKNIRLKFLNESKTANYIKYAIGEIVLVMIGILLALQVNSWNQSRLDRIEEKNILAKLHDEFLENKTEVDKSTAIYKSAMNSNSVLMNLIGSDEATLQKHNLDSLFYESLPSLQIVLSNNTVKNIVLSGKLNTIKNAEIIKLINQWEAHLVLIKEREKTLLDWINNQLIPLISDYVPFKQMDAYGNMPWSGKSKLKSDYYRLFQQLKYENVLDNVLWYHNKNRLSLEIANDLILKIIKATEPYKK